MKIAMIGHKRIPSREGGVEIVVQELSTRLAAKGHDVCVYNRGGHHVSGSEYDYSEKLHEYQGVRIKTVLTINKKGLAAMTSSMFATIRTLFGHYDVIHYHAEGPCAMLWLPHLFGIRTVATIHGLDWQRAKWGGFAVKYLKLGEKTAAKYADEVVVLSENVRRYFKDTYGRKTAFIPNGVSEPQIREADVIRKKWGLKKDSYILFLGRIVPEKGIHYLIDVYRTLETDKRLVIAGGASDTDTYMAGLKAKATGEDRILFTGFVQGEPLEELYANAYLYVLPSDLEGMPLSLLEAMSYGNCCLVSDIPECAEVVEDQAATFRKGDVADLRDKLAELIRNPDTVQAYKKNAATFVCGKYSWDTVVSETLALYQI